MDIANTFVGPFITKVADYTVAAIGRQLGYIIFYKKKLDDLGKKLVDLDGVREKVQNMVNVEESKYYKIQVDVEPWLKRANEIIELHKPILSDQDNESEPKKMSPHCLNVIQRHKLGRKARKMVEEINEIIEKGKAFDKVGYPLPLVNIDSSSIPGYQYVASRFSIAKDIKDALAETSNSKVGIHGMGGVGKTMLVKEVERLLKEHKLFDPVITVTIGQSIDVKVIQKKMIEMLRWEFEVESEEATAALIRNNLMKMKNKVLIVLDDLWNKLKLEDVGIPCGCKILITSRDKHVLTNEMGVETNFIFEVKSLSETEAWEFFKNKIGEIDKNSIEPIAMKVAKKCGGLPIALDTVGKTLKGKTQRIWKDALKRLQKPSAVNITGMTTEVYVSLRLSYDFIKNDEAKLIFLLCSVFPDDYEIPLEKLAMYAMGMRLLHGVDTWEEAKDRIEALVDILKSSSLLLRSDVIDYMKMHDVVRDVAIYISSEEGSQMSTLYCGYEESEWKDKCGSYRAIFANYDGFLNLPQDLKFPKLELLILNSETTFFAGMEEIKVLDISGILCFQEQTTSLRNLRTLYMEHCEFKDIDIIGEFKELEVLIIDDCGIDELPETMSQLTKLKVLRCSSYCDVKVIPFNIISKMMYLEELSLVGFKGWGKEVVYKGKSIQNAKLSEFKYLQHLTVLNLTIPCVNSLSDLSFSDNLKLERFDINIGKYRGYNKRGKSLRYFRIHSESEIVLNDDVDKILLKRCDKLRLEASRDISNLLFKSNGNYGYPDLRHLSLLLQDRFKLLLDGELIPFFDDQVSFPKLESLEFIKAGKLKMLWKDNGMISNSFCKLGRINIINCVNLRYMFPCSAMTTLVSLKVLKIERCVSLKGIFAMKESYILKENDDVALPKLSFVRVQDCPKFKSVFPASIKCLPQLKTLLINRGPCELLSEDKRLEIAQSNSSPFLEDQIVFSNLRSLTLSYKAIKINSLVTQFSRAESFPKLKLLILEGSNDDDDYNWNTLPLGFRQILFSPKELHICRVCVWKDNTEIWKMFFDHLELPNSIKLNSFPNLKSLSINECNGLKNLLNSSVVKRLVNLEKMSIFRCRGMISIVDGDEEEEEIIFKKLVDLNIGYLERLECFYFGKSKLMFPCLKILSIHGCSEMKIFSNGHIRKPKIRLLNIDCPGIFKEEEEEEEVKEEQEEEEEEEDYDYEEENDTDSSDY